jgi:hypothetical protein
MKPSLTLILLSFFFLGVDAQVKIGGTPVAPVPSAVLELDGGTTRGLLLPRMRKMDIDAIANPDEGLTIYATDLQAVFLRRSGNWVQMNGASDAFSLPYVNQFNHPGAGVLYISNTASNGVAIMGQSLGNGFGVRGFTQTGIGLNGTSQNLAGVGGYFANNEGGRSLVSLDKTGIGTASPDVLLHIDGSSSTGNTILVNDDVDPIIQFQKVGINKSYIKQQGNDLVFRPNGNNTTGKVVLQSYNSGGWFFLDADGNAVLGQDPATYVVSPTQPKMYVKGNLTLESTNGSGPQLTLSQKTGNVITTRGDIRCEQDHGLDFYSDKGYYWYGNGGTPAMILKRNANDPSDLNLGVGSIGIGIGFNNDPKAALHINNFGPAGSDKTMIINADAGYPTFVSFQQSKIEKGFIQQLDNDLKIGTVAINDPGRFIVRTNGFDRLWVDSVGYVTIGGKIGPTINGPYRLAVRGKIAATDFNVVATGSWPDYVFSPSYKLRSLEETEAYINEHKHLPNIPAAAVVEKEGFALGDMQKRMMEKIEELTLYLIEAKKEINTLKQQMQVLQANK